VFELINEFSYRIFDNGWDEFRTYKKNKDHMKKTYIIEINQKKE